MITGRGVAVASVCPGRDRDHPPTTLCPCRNVYYWLSVICNIAKHYLCHLLKHVQLDKNNTEKISKY